MLKVTDNGERELKNLFNNYCECPDIEMRSFIYSKVIELNTQIQCGLIQN